MNCLSWADRLPNRVAVPNSTTSAHSMSSTDASGMSAVAAWWAAHAGFDWMASHGASSGALVRRTSAPALTAASLSSLAISVTVPVEE